MDFELIVNEGCPGKLSEDIIALEKISIPGAIRMVRGSAEYWRSVG